MTDEALGSAIGLPQRERALARRRRGQWFFPGLALAVAVTVLVGFSRTDYFKGPVAAPSLPALFHVHGTLFTAWVLLFIAQAFLSFAAWLTR